MFQIVKLHQAGQTDRQPLLNRQDRHVLSKLLHSQQGLKDLLTLPLLQDRKAAEVQVHHLEAAVVRDQRDQVEDSID